MSFKTLEQRYNERVNDLYSAAQIKFDGGKESNGRNDDPIITRRVGDGYWGFGESRSVPVRSAALDVQRVTLFTLSQRGIAFLAKQQLLQTGNTFQHTRLINPVFAIGNAVPFLHVRRQLRPLSPIKNIFWKTDASSFSRTDLRLRGQLQEETYNKLSNRPEDAGFSWKKIPIIGQTLSAINAPISIGEIKPWGESRPELEKIKALWSFTGLLYQQKDTLMFQEELPWRSKLRNTPTIDSPFSDTPQLPESNQINVPLSIADANERFRQATSGENPFELRGITVNATRNNETAPPDNSRAFIRYFESDPESIRTRSQGVGYANNLNARDLASPARSANRKIRYLRDPLNEKAVGTNVLDFYKDLYTYGDDRVIKDDPILVSFAMGNNNHVQFRAFIRDLNQTANPEYKSYQYIGRTERFVTYTGIERELNFKLDVLSFSKDELYIVWKRINYLTGMVFPYGVNNGILQPNIMRFTIGQLFVNQIGYVSSFSTQFNEISESWDIDKEVPIGATVNMGVKIIEKRRMDASQPMYGITEVPEPPQPVLVNDPNLFIPSFENSELNQEIPVSTPREIQPPPIIG